MAPLKFSNEINAGFTAELRKRIKNYFDEKGISKLANLNMVLKTVFMLSLFLVPYWMMISGVFTSPLLILVLWAGMGIGAAGIGLSIMHDANHKAYSKSKWINRLLGYLLNMIGGHAPAWEIQHNVKHHGYTNIDGYDEDINAGGLLRFSPNEPLYKIHRFQYYYAWLLYCFMTLKWVTTKDFMQMFRYRRDGYLPASNLIFTQKIILMSISKLLYFGYLLVIPILLLPLEWWLILIFFLMMHFITGFILTIIFQTAHVMPSSKYPVPDEANTIEHSWTMHQLATTTNYAPGNKIFSWLIGGLNYQVEHHLFPNICHVHYPRLSLIVKETAHEFNITYNSLPTFFSALIHHGRMLKQMGRRQ